MPRGPRRRSIKARRHIAGNRVAERRGGRAIAIWPATSTANTSTLNAAFTVGADLPYRSSRPDVGEALALQMSDFGVAGRNDVVLENLKQTVGVDLAADKRVVADEKRDFLRLQV